MSFDQVALAISLVAILFLTYYQGRTQTKLSQLDTDVQAVSDAEAALEARVLAHENHDTLVAIDLQNQIDALKNGGDTTAAIAGLEALKTKMDNFDATATP